jgi:hypothetical protein
VIASVFLRQVPLTRSTAMESAPEAVEAAA